MTKETVGINIVNNTIKIMTELYGAEVISKVKPPVFVSIAQNDKVVHANFFTWIDFK